MRRFLLVVILSFLCWPVGYCGIEAIDVSTGYLNSNLDNTHEKYQGFPLLVGLEFDIKPLLSKVWLNTKGRADFILEPFINTITSPDSNVEVGSNFLLQYVFPLHEKIQPYVKGGLGVLYMSQHTREQSTQYNFLPQGAGGVQYFIKDNLAINLEYRYRHLSNASIKHPNSGIDSNLYLGGVTYFFGAKKKEEDRKSVV